MQETIYKEYHDKVAGYVHSHVGNYHDAEDIVSNVFMKVYSKWDSFDSTKASVSTWIYTITANTVKDYYKLHRSFEEVPVEMSSDDQIEEGILEEETLQELADALKKLPERERDMIILHYYKNIQLKEIAAMMNMSYSNAKIVHKAALQKLKALIS